MIEQLETITTGNGYNFTLSGVGRRGALANDLPVEVGKPYLTLLFPRDLRERRPAGLTRVVLHFEIWGFVKVRDANTLDPDNEKDKLIEDIERCLNSDRTLSGLITQTLLDSFDSDYAWDGPYYMITAEGRLVYFYSGINS